MINSKGLRGTIQRLLIKGGGVDYVFEFGPKDIDKAFREKNKKILEAERGNGYWLWKPYIVKQVLHKMNDGDWMVYSDSGMFYLNNVRQYITKLEQQGINAVNMGSYFKEGQYTKRDAFAFMDLDAPEYVDTPQRQGGVFLLKKNKVNVCIMEEWLAYAQDERIITDLPNQCGLDNYSDFIDHRHDQSILSLLGKKYGIPAKKLFVDFNHRKSSKAILCYHHSVYGNLVSIACHWYIETGLRNIKKPIKAMLRI